MPATATPDTPSFHVESLHEAGVVVIAVHGKLDMATAPHLDDHVTMAQRDRGHVLLDMGSAPFVDSAGFRSLYRAHHEITRQGRRFALAGPDGSAIARMLDLTGATRLLERFPDRVTAIAALRG